MQEKMRELAELKDLIAAIKDTQDRIYADAVTNNPEYQELARKKEVAKMQADALEYELENWALSEFRKTGSKKPMPKLTIRENTKVEYDTVTAEQWAKTNLPDAFKFDAKTFEKYATTVKCPDFARVKKVPSASVGADLTEYLQSKSDEI